MKDDADVRKDQVLVLLLAVEAGEISGGMFRAVMGYDIIQARELRQAAIDKAHAICETWRKINPAVVPEPAAVKPMTKEQEYEQAQERG